MMAMVALRAAIQQVQNAVERVEGKVDDLVALAKAETIADVLAPVAVRKYRKVA